MLVNVAPGGWQLDATVAVIEEVGNHALRRLAGKQAGKVGFTLGDN